ncbi:hypothetical protein QJS66_01485 [Kocuria rhizophila]|nr:hypothetical protein QJS66_01485 [Kocuria rhizophila]
MELDLTEDPDLPRAPRSRRRARRTFIDAIHRLGGVRHPRRSSLDPAEVSDGERIQLPGLAAQNELVVESTMRYGVKDTGEGLHRFVRPADGQVYLYSQFEVADARRMSPVFEQPDLKATLPVLRDGPAAWAMVSKPASPARGSLPRAWPLDCHARDVLLRDRADRRPPYLSAHDSLVSSDGRTVELGAMRARRSLVRAHGRRDVRGHQAGLQFFESQFDALPVREVRPLFVPSSTRAPWKRGCGHVRGVLHLPLQACPRLSWSAAPSLCSTSSRTCGSGPGDHALVERPVAQRVLRGVHVHPGVRAERAVRQRLDHVRGRGRSGRGYAQDQLPTTHPVKAESGPRGRARELRRHHLRQGHLPCSSGWSRGWARRSSWPGSSGTSTSTRGPRPQLSDLMVELEAASGRDLTDWSERWPRPPG